jgi:hypothetical protein
MYNFLCLQVVEVSDRYIVCGDNYTRIREAITKVILGENVEHLFETVQVRFPWSVYMYHLYIMKWNCTICLWQKNRKVCRSLVGDDVVHASIQSACFFYSEFGEVSCLNIDYLLTYLLVADHQIFLLLQ